MIRSFLNGKTRAVGRESGVDAGGYPRGKIPADGGRAVEHDFRLEMIDDCAGGPAA